MALDHTPRNSHELSIPRVVRATIETMEALSQRDEDTGKPGLIDTVLDPLDSDRSIRS